MQVNLHETNCKLPGLSLARKEERLYIHLQHRHEYPRGQEWTTQSSGFPSPSRYRPNNRSDSSLPWLDGDVEGGSSSCFLIVRPQPTLSIGTTRSPILNRGFESSALIVFCHCFLSSLDKQPAFDAKLALESGTVLPPNGVCVKFTPGRPVVACHLHLEHRVVTLLLSLQVAVPRHSEQSGCELPVSRIKFKKELHSRLSFEASGSSPL